MMAQLDLWPDEVAALPWGGRSPRCLVQESVKEKLERFGAGGCRVDKSVVRCESREALRIDVDPAQYKCLVEAP